MSKLLTDEDLEALEADARDEGSDGVMPPTADWEDVLLLIAEVRSARRRATHGPFVPCDNPTPGGPGCPGPYACHYRCERTPAEHEEER